MERSECCEEKTRRISTGRLFAFWFVLVQVRIIVTVGVHDIVSIFVGYFGCGEEIDVIHIG